MSMPRRFILPALIALPNLDGSYTYTLFWPKSGLGGLDSLRTPTEMVG